MKKNVINGKLYYSYIESGYFEQDFKLIYDLETRCVDCCLKLPDSNGKYLIEMSFETPDGKYKDFIISNINKSFANGDTNLKIGFNIKNLMINNSQILIKGEFVLEIKEEIDGFHFFLFTIQIYDSPININSIAKHLERIKSLKSFQCHQPFLIQYCNS